MNAEPPAGRPPHDLAGTVGAAWERRDYAAVLGQVSGNLLEAAADAVLLQRGAVAAHDLGCDDIAERLYRRAFCAEPNNGLYRYLFKLRRRAGRQAPDVRLLHWARAIEPNSRVVLDLLRQNREGAPAPAPRAGPGATSGPSGVDAAPDPAADAAAAAAGGTAGAAVRVWLLAGLAMLVLPVAGAGAGWLATSGLEWWWRAAGALGGLLLPVALLELYGFARLAGETGRILAPARRLLEESNSYVREVTEVAGGAGRPFRRRSFAASMTPHPYLAYVNRPPRDPAHPFRPNNYGFFNRPIPYQRDPSRFHVLVTGGSVATQFAQMSLDGPRYLEDALNRRFLPPKGERFVVLNGALGGWRYPQQVGVAAMTASAVDAVVTLDGFNEAAMMLRDGVLVETPGRKFLMSNPTLEHGYDRMVGDWLAGWVYERSLRHWWIRHSSYLCLVSQRLRQALASAFVPADDRSYLLRLFEMPRLGRERRWEYAVGRYCDYIRFLHGACRQVGIRSAHFLQPIPGIGKTLSAEEAGYPRPLGDQVAELFRMMEAAMADMAAKEGVTCASLLEVFAGRGDTIYADWPHCLRDKHTGESEGYRLMAEAVAGELGRLWSLRERADGQSSSNSSR